MIGHVVACVTGDAENLIEPASALPALELTLQVHEQLNQPRQSHGASTADREVVASDLRHWRARQP